MRIILKKEIIIALLFVSITSHNEAAATDSLPVSVYQLGRNWSGPYIGFNAGGVWGSFQPRSVTDAGGGFTEEQAMAFNTVGSLQSINPSGYSAGITGGHNWQFGHALFGIETDIQGMHFSGATNWIGALPDTDKNFFNINSYARTNWLITLRPRIGLTINNILLYGTAGIATTTVSSDSNVIAHKGLGPSDTSLASIGSINSSKLGYALGGGVEYALSNSMSVKAEYLYTQFTSTYTTAAVNSLLASYPAQQFSHSINMNSNLARLGVNYKIGEPIVVKSTVSTNDNQDWASFTNFEVDTGARAWVSSGNVGAPQPLYNWPNNLVSRLIYNDEQGYTYEAFGRVDHKTGLFTKGYLGAGGITSGKLNDEDFPAGGGYSNTVMNNNQGSLSYATLDLGYTFLRSSRARAGAFIGYNYYGQQISSYGCTQIALSSECSSPGISTIGVANDNRYHSLRVGLSTEADLTEKLKLTTDAAYIPYSDYRGHDDHNNRQLHGPEAARGGYGAMLEGILSYEFIENWSVGLGARYWAFNTSTGTDKFEYLGGTDVTSIFPARFNTERYGGFVQLSHKIGGVSKNKLDIKLNDTSTNWSGLFVGGHVGGGFGNSYWSDKYGFESDPARTENGVVVPPTGNAPGFGNYNHSMGPLGGGQIGFNYQINQWVIGGQADASGVDMRGEYTCFSGLGGVNCMTTINSIGTVTARGGYAFDKVLLFVKGGGGWANSNFDLNGYTGVRELGSGSYNAFYWGWAAGFGLEYAVDEKWSVVAEFNNLWFNPNASFPSIDNINQSYVNIRQNLDTFKFGVNYRIGLK